MHALMLKTQNLQKKIPRIQTSLEFCLTKHLVSDYDFTPKIYKYLVTFGTKTQLNDIHKFLICGLLIGLSYFVSFTVTAYQ